MLFPGDLTGLLGRVVPGEEHHYDHGQNIPPGVSWGCVSSGLSVGSMPVHSIPGPSSGWQDKRKHGIMVSMVTVTM